MFPLALSIGSNQQIDCTRQRSNDASPEKFNGIISRGGNHAYVTYLSSFFSGKINAGRSSSQEFLEYDSRFLFVIFAHVKRILTTEFVSTRCGRQYILFSFALTSLFFRIFKSFLRRIFKLANCYSKLFFMNTYICKYALYILQRVAIQLVPSSNQIDTRPPRQSYTERVHRRVCDNLLSFSFFVLVMFMEGQ